MKKFDGFMHGVNLGGWFSQCDYSEDRLNNFIKEEDLKIISGWKMDHIRLPIDYNIVENKDGSIKEDGYARIDKVIEWCKKYNLNMILDLHKTAGFSFDKFHMESGFFENEEYQKRFYNLWDNLSRHFADAFKGTNQELCFEILNEVTEQEYCKKWNEIAKNCIKTIRVNAPKIKILVGSYWNNSVASVKDLDEPYDENIVYNFHCYEPLLFTHQGAPWIEKMNTSLKVAFKTPFAEYKRLTEENVGQVGTKFDGFAPDALPDESYFETIFAEAISVAEKRNVLLYCGEYGVIERATPEDTVAWYKTISTVFNKNGIGRAAWSYRQMDFGLSDTRLDSVRNELLKYV